MIPARYRSTRFPGKALADIGGKPMVVRVCERARKSGAKSVTVATDDARIRDAVEKSGFGALMTRAGHASGTDRIAEAAERLRLSANEVVVNVQGDEPLISPALIARVAAILKKRRAASMSTACHPIRDAASLASPNVVKVVLDAEDYALYFSRARIPFPRESRGLSEKILQAEARPARKNRGAGAAEGALARLSHRRGRQQGRDCSRRRHAAGSRRSA